MMFDGFSDESRDFLARIRYRHAAGEVGHVCAERRVASLYHNKIVRHFRGLDFDIPACFQMLARVPGGMS
jgi:hypothetical protein